MVRLQAQIEKQIAELQITVGRQRGPAELRTAQHSAQRTLGKLGESGIMAQVIMRLGNMGTDPEEIITLEN